MAEILVRFDDPIAAPGGKRYFAQAVASQVKGGLWEGWLEFFPVSEGVRALESARETTQPGRIHVEYWSQGLTKVYLEGALARAVALAERPRQPLSADYPPARFNDFGHRAITGSSTRGPVVPRPVLNPIQAYARGEAILRNELSALSRDHLESIATAYDLVPFESSAALRLLSTNELIARIVDGARSRQRPFAADSDVPRAEL
ncbi:MAG TPA: hypothetical protein VNO75_07640 [Gemmatimonadaceae bacterium]|nr:hypothetical protein [Gemmatimonadaceae bacterium]